MGTYSAIDSWLDGWQCGHPRGCLACNGRLLLKTEYCLARCMRSSKSGTIHDDLGRGHRAVPMFKTPSMRDPRSGVAPDSEATGARCHGEVRWSLARR